MIPELGQFALILALCLCGLQILVPLFFNLLTPIRSVMLSRSLAYGQTAFVLFAFFALAICFLSNDFSVAYVAQNSNLDLPTPYKFAAIWSAHEGSLLLWVTVLALWTFAVARFSRSLSSEMITKILAVMAAISIGFLLFLLMTSNPFTRLLPNFPHNGQDLNPLLQDPGLAIHPPMLYMGYVGFSVAFAFAIAALWQGRVDAAFTKWLRPWTIAAWCFLTFGITLGSWWSYRVLGWGGWWFWDPVENASFMPWLTGTALIHCLAVTEKRGAFKSWTILLAIATFSLSLIGTFLVRSGVLVSVHAFAVDPTRGDYLLKFIFCVVGISLLLYAIRAPSLRSQQNFSLSSRETFLLSNNVFLVVAMATVLLGTLYPLVLQALNFGKISVGPPYFNTVFIPIFVPLLFLMAIGPFSNWRQTDFKKLLKPFSGFLLISILLAVVLPFIFAKTNSWMVVLGLSLSFWIISSMIFAVKQKIKTAKKISHIPAHFWGMVFAHIGMAVAVIGISCTSYFSLEQDLKMQPGDAMTIGSYRVLFNGNEQRQAENYQAFLAEFSVYKNNHLIATMFPEKRYFPVAQLATSIPAILINPVRDFYIALGEPIGNQAWAVRIYDKPFVRFIWLGGLLMLSGGLFALMDRRYHEHKKN